MKRETKAEREAWSKHFGLDTKKPSKMRNERVGKYASKREANMAANLSACAKGNDIWALREQVKFVLVPGDKKCSAITYIADFTYHDNAGYHVLDAKGFKTDVYRLKKRLMHLLLGIEIEEV